MGRGLGFIGWETGGVGGLENGKWKPENGKRKTENGRTGERDWVGKNDTGLLGFMIVFSTLTRLCFFNDELNETRTSISIYLYMTVFLNISNLQHTPPNLSLSLLDFFDSY